ncbi:MAG TPA: translin family protein [Methanosarcinales archaeon]|nr:translin family protein [Methanosarcinales archaeon]
MSSISEISQAIKIKFDSKDSAREQALKLSREVIRLSGNAIRAIHRKEYNRANELLQDEKSILDNIKSILENHKDIYYAGFVEDAQQEYAEAILLYSIITKENTANLNTLPDPEEIEVEYAPYLKGLGDLVGELRRHILDLIRRDKEEDGENFLELMEDIYTILMHFDYPDAITHGLRRKVDIARSIIERTRGDLTNAIQCKKLMTAILQ